MGQADYYLKGDWNITCDLCGRKVKAAFTMKTWNNLYVCSYHKEIRNEQDFLRGVKDNQSVPFSRPEPNLIFTNGNTYSPQNLVATAGLFESILTWVPIFNSTFNIYWSTVSGAGINGTEIQNVTSPYVQSGLTPGTTYYYVVTAVNPVTGESPPSNQASDTPYSLFVIVGSNATKQTAYSHDNGATWTAGTLTSATAWNNIACGNSEFVTTNPSTGGDTSVDGISFVSGSTIPSTGNPNSLVFGNGIWLITDSGDKTIHWSKDLIHWNSVTVPTSEGAWDNPVFGNGIFCIFNKDDIAHSPDCITWTLTSGNPAAQAVTCAAYGNGVFSAICGTSGSGIYSTNNGSTWSPFTAPSTDNWTSMCFMNGIFVSVAQNTSKSAYASDGKTYTLGVLPSSADWVSVSACGNTAIAISGNSTAAAYGNGQTWTATTLPNYLPWKAIAGAV